MAEASLIQFRRTELPSYQGSFVEYLEELDQSAGSPGVNAVLPLKHGEPVFFDNNYWNDNLTYGSPALFIGAYRQNSGDLDIMPFHIGPYYGSNGIYVERDPFSANIGEIQLRLHSTDNSLSITSGNGWYNLSASLGGLNNVTLSSPTNGQVLVYNASTSQWVNSTISTSATGNATGATSMTLIGLDTTTFNLAENATHAVSLNDIKVAYENHLLYSNTGVYNGTKQSEWLCVDAVQTGQIKREGLYAFRDKNSALHFISDVEPALQSWPNWTANVARYWHQFVDVDGIVLQSNMLTTLSSAYSISTTSATSYKFWPVVCHDDTFNSPSSPKLAVRIPDTFSSYHNSSLRVTENTLTTSDESVSDYSTVRNVLSLTDDVTIDVDSTPTNEMVWYLSNESGNAVTVTLDCSNLSIEKLALFGRGTISNASLELSVNDRTVTKVSLFTETFVNTTNERTAVFEVVESTDYTTVARQ